MSSTSILAYKRNPFLALHKRKLNRKQKSVVFVLCNNEYKLKLKMMDKGSWFDEEDLINKNSSDTEASVSGVY